MGIIDDWGETQTQAPIRFASDNMAATATKPKYSDKDKKKPYRFGIGSQSLVEFFDRDLVVVDVQLLFQIIQILLTLFATLCGLRGLSPILK